jgi:hypothetical protein
MARLRQVFHTSCLPKTLGAFHPTIPTPVSSPPPSEILAGLRAMGLLSPGAGAAGEPLAGGASSDIWRLDLPGRGPVCVKRALPKLRVAADWRAPTARNLYEARWMQRAAAADARRAAPARALRRGDARLRPGVDPADPLRRLPNGVLTPHVGWLTTGTFERSLALAAENCRRLAAGAPLRHRVA